MNDVTKHNKTGESHMKTLKYWILSAWIITGITPTLLHATKSQAVQSKTNAVSSKVIGLDPSNSSGYELLLVDPATGEQNLISTIENMDTSSGTGAIDNLHQYLYQIGSTDGDPVLKIFTLDAVSGAVLSSPSIDRTVSSLWVRKDRQLVGLSSNGSAQELVLIDPSTGSTAVISEIAELGTLVDTGAIDVIKNQLYQTDTSYKIFTIDVMSGTIISAPSLDRKVTSLFVKRDHQLIGLAWNGEEKELVSVDPNTGQTTIISVIENMDASLSSAIDNLNNRLYVIGEDLDDPDARIKIFTIDTMTGMVLSAVPIDDASSIFVSVGR